MYEQRFVIVEMSFSSRENFAVLVDRAKLKETCTWDLMQNPSMQLIMLILL